MNGPISLVNVEKEILRLVNELENEVSAFEELCVDDAQKAARYKKEWASEYLTAKGSIPEREAWADYKVDDMLFDTKVAEALVKAKRERLSMLRTNIEALRTISANVRNLT